MVYLKNWFVWRIGLFEELVYLKKWFSWRIGLASGIDKSLPAGVPGDE